MKGGEALLDIVDAAFRRSPPGEDRAVWLQLRKDENGETELVAALTQDEYEALGLEEEPDRDDG